MAGAADSPEYLTLDDVVDLIRMLAIGPIRDLGLLDAAVNRPRASAFGADAYPSLDLKAAALLQSLVGNHALVDGNKRIGLYCVTVFLDLNEHPLSIDDDAAFDLTMDVARGLDDVEEIARRLR